MRVRRDCEDGLVGGGKWKYLREIETPYDEWVSFWLVRSIELTPPHFI